MKIQPDTEPKNPMGTALVTGASCGIGKAYAERLAARGYDLILTGRREDKLRFVSEEIKNRYGIGVQIILAEFSDEQQVNALAARIKKRDDITFLVNNAGFGSGERFCQCSMNEHLKMLNVHVTATMKLIHAVMPQMTERKKGAIINVSSMGAFVPASGSAMYSGTKLFLKSFTESLHLEVRHQGVKVQCVCPGFTRTDFHRRRDAGNNSRQRTSRHMMEAGTVAEMSLKALGRGKVVFIPGRMNRVVVTIVQLLPKKWYYGMMEYATSKKKWNGSKAIDLSPAH